MENAIETLSNGDVVVTIRTRAWSVDRRPNLHRIAVSADGVCRVYNPLEGYYTTVHSLSAAAQRRARKLAGR